MCAHDDSQPGQVCQRCSVKKPEGVSLRRLDVGTLGRAHGRGLDVSALLPAVLEVGVAMAGLQRQSIRSSFVQHSCYCVC